ncbi:MAG: hypothetical protein ACR2Q4_14445, partial [Geminicoccaceae bacterium]
MISRLIALIGVAGFLGRLIGDPKSFLPGSEGRNNQDSIKGWTGRAIRERIYAVTTPQRYGNMSFFDLFRDPKAWMYLFIGSFLHWVLSHLIDFSSMSWIIGKLFYVPALWR